MKVLRHSEHAPSPVPRHSTRDGMETAAAPKDHAVPHVRPRPQPTLFKTTQYRQRTIVSQQSIMKNELPKCRVKQVRDRMAIEIDNKYPSPRHATHLTKNLNHLLVNKVVREE